MTAPARLAATHAERFEWVASIHPHRPDAIEALQAGRSLLPIGVTAVDGEFARGAVIACRDAQGREIARGLVNYASNDARRITRKPSTEIESILGFVEEPELIHRDNLVRIG